MPRILVQVKAFINLLMASALSEISSLSPKFIEAFSPMISALKAITSWIAKTIQTLLNTGKTTHQWSGEFILGNSFSVEVVTHLGILAEIPITTVNWKTLDDSVERGWERLTTEEGDSVSSASQMMLRKLWYILSLMFGDNMKYAQDFR